MDDRKKQVHFLREPHSEGPPISPEAKQLKKDIMGLVHRTRAADDYCQSKFHFKEKVKDVVRVPRSHYFGDQIERIGESVMALDDFVLKANHLSRGIGVRVLKRQGATFTDINGEDLSLDELLEECSALLNLQRQGATRGIIVEERLLGHPRLEMHGAGIADIRMLYYRNDFLYCVARFPSEASSGYANTSRGAFAGYVLGDGRFVRDPRFQPEYIEDGELPFFKEMQEAGRKVAECYGMAFQAVDMTVDAAGEVVAIETDFMVQLECDLTIEGVKWLRSVMAKDLEISPWTYSILLNSKRVERLVDRLLRGHARTS